MAQRITRAKRKITEAGIPYRIPDPDELGARLTDVLAVIYLLFNEGYLSTAGAAALTRPRRRRRVARRPAAPAHADRARGCRAARADPAASRPGRRPLRRRRTASSCSSRAGPVAVGPRGHRRGDPLLDPAARQHRPGPVPAAGGDRRLPRRGGALGRTPTGSRSCCSTTCCCTSRRRRSPACTGRSRCGTPPVREPRWPSSTRSPRPSTGHHLYHATRAELLRALGQQDPARDADRRALGLTANPAERRCCAAASPGRSPPPPYRAAHPAPGQAAPVGAVGEQDVGRADAGPHRLDEVPPGVPGRERMGQ